MVRRHKTAQLDPWRKSATFRAIARQSAQKNHQGFRARPRCGAKRKRDGKPCTHPAMKNGRCRLHGGKTPKGKNWHVIQYPDCSTPEGEAKFVRKLRQQERYAKQRAERLTAMTPEQRLAHEAWHRTHRPGLTEAAKRANRERQRQDRDLRRLLAQASPETTPGASAKPAGAGRQRHGAYLRRSDASSMIDNNLLGVQLALQTAKAGLARLEAVRGDLKPASNADVFS